MNSHARRQLSFTQAVRNSTTTNLANSEGCTVMPRWIHRLLPLKRPPTPGTKHSSRIVAATSGTASSRQR